jgi:hypothetical protein
MTVHIVVMAFPDDLGEDRLRTIVREELLRTTRSLVGTVLWTVLSLFAVLVGLQSLQFAWLASSALAVVGFGLAGVFVTGASIYLLYALHVA